MKNKPPSISVLLPIYKEPKTWITQSIESILTQTFQDFELLLLLDNPSDKKLIQFLKEFEKDSRVHLSINPKNIGLPQSLNKGIELAKGKYVARLDADDIALPNRLQSQFSFMELNPKIALCGTNLLKLDETDKPLKESQHQNDMPLFKELIHFKNIITHTTWLIRKETFNIVGLYRNLPNAEDYDFVYRLLDKGLQLAILPEVLVHIRIHTKGQTGGQSLVQKVCFKYIQQLHQQRIESGKDNFDKEKLKGIIQAQTDKYGQQQQRAQHYLMQNFQAMKKRNYLIAGFYLVGSFFISPIQRNYYLDLLKAKLIVWKYSFGKR